MLLPELEELVLGLRRRRLCRLCRRVRQLLTDDTGLKNAFEFILNNRQYTRSKTVTITYWLRLELCFPCLRRFEISLLLEVLVLLELLLLLLLLELLLRLLRRLPRVRLKNSSTDRLLYKSQLTTGYFAIRDSTSRSRGTSSFRKTWFRGCVGPGSCFSQTAQRLKSQQLAHIKRAPSMTLRQTEQWTPS